MRPVASAEMRVGTSLAWSMVTVTMPSTPWSIRAGAEAAHGLEPVDVVGDQQHVGRGLALAVGAVEAQVNPAEVKGLGEKPQLASVQGDRDLEVPSSGAKHLLPDADRV